MQLVVRSPNELSAGSMVAEELRYHTTGRRLTGGFVPQAALYSLMLLMMGKTVARNMSS